VGNVRAVLQGGFDQRLGALAVAAPGRAELDHRGAGQAVHIVSGWGLCKVLCGVGHGVMRGL